MLTVCTAFAVLGACASVRRGLSSRPERSFWKGRVQLRPLWNQGAAFDLPIGRQALVLLSAAALALTALWRRRNPLAAGLILGGGAGNLWERLAHGRVFDYLRFPKAPGWIKRYVYNLADLMIFAGGLLMLLCPKRR